MPEDKILQKDTIIVLLASIIAGLLFGWIIFFISLIVSSYIAKLLRPKLMIEDQRDKIDD